MTAVPQQPAPDQNGGAEKMDPLLDEIRSIKSAISDRFDHDVRKLGTHLMRQQEANRDRLVFRKPIAGK